MILQDSTLIMVRPEAVFRFFEEMEAHYLAWHPDHVLFRWERDPAHLHSTPAVRWTPPNNWPHVSPMPTSLRSRPE